MYDDFKKNGFLEIKVVRGSDFYRSDYDTMYLSAKELNDLINMASGNWFMHKVRFYANPINFYRNLLPKIRSYDDLRYFIKVFGNLYKRKVQPILREKFRGRPPKVALAPR